MKSWKKALMKRKQWRNEEEEGEEVEKDEKG